VLAFLHVCVSDGIMEGGIRAVHESTNGKDLPPNISMAADLAHVQGGTLPAPQRSVIGVTRVSAHVRNLVTRGFRSNDLNNKDDVVAALVSRSFFVSC